MPGPGEPQVAAPAREGKYLYCVADSGAEASLGPIGIEGREAYTIPHQDVCAVVHRGPVEPYRSAAEETVQAWIAAHHGVVAAAWERWGTVLPVAFDTIIRDPNGDGPEDRVRDWLCHDYESLRKRLDKVRGKAEYGVQVSWNPRAIAEEILAASPQMGALAQEVVSKPRGLAYLHRQRLEQALKREMEAKADACFRDFYQRIRRHVTDIAVGKTRQGEPDSQMIMNLACLLPATGAADLGQELESIHRTPGFAVRFTGPWPPYSFAGA